MRIFKINNSEIKLKSTMHKDLPNDLLLMLTEPELTSSVENYCFF
jgi:hypothetical protein